MSKVNTEKVEIVSRNILHIFNPSLVSPIYIFLSAYFELLLMKVFFAMSGFYKIHFIYCRHIIISTNPIEAETYKYLN